MKSNKHTLLYRSLAINLIGQFLDLTGFFIRHTQDESFTKMVVICVIENLSDLRLNQTVACVDKRMTIEQRGNVFDV